MRVRPDAVLARDVFADSDHRAPFCEARAELAILREPFAEPVEPFGDRLAFGQRERFRSLVDLDARNDSLGLEQLGERRPVGRLLADRLVEENHAADEILGSLRREEKLPVLPARLLGGLDPDRVESLLDRPVALVRGEDALALGDDLLGDSLQLLKVHLRLLSRLCPGRSIP